LIQIVEFCFACRIADIIDIRKVGILLQSQFALGKIEVALSLLDLLL